MQPHEAHIPFVLQVGHLTICISIYCSLVIFRVVFSYAWGVELSYCILFFEVPAYQMLKRGIKLTYECPNEATFVLSARGCHFIHGYNGDAHVQLVRKITSRIAKYYAENNNILYIHVSCLSSTVEHLSMLSPT